MFDTLQDRLAATFKGLRGKGRLTDADIDATTRQIRIALLEADVNLSVVKEFVAAVKERCRGEELSKALNPTQQIIKIVNEELVDILGGETRTVRFAKNPPTVIMLAGLQGAGKTTLAGKLAAWFKAEGYSPMLAACDLQRPNAVTQLQVVGERAGVQVFAPEPGNGVGNPIQVAQDAIAEAQRKLYDVVIIDTAGRLGVDEELMAQAADIKAVTHPDETLFVVDAMIGQDAVNTAVAFQQGVGFDGVVLTKLDGDARGGAALSIARVVGTPIMFASSGEGLKDFDVFHPDRMASRILDMGDMLTLIEQAEKAFDARQSEEAAAKIMAGKGEFGLDDFLGMMRQMRRMGPMSKIMGMLPGMGQMKDQIESIDVNSLVNRFVDARKMMGQMTQMMGPGAGRVMGSVAKRGKKSKKKNRRGSGNPAKRAAQERAAAQGRANKKQKPQGSAFGLGNSKSSQADLQQAMSEFQMPSGMEKMLKQANKGRR